MRNTVLKNNCIVQNKVVETLDFQKARQRFFKRKRLMFYQRCLGFMVFAIGVLLCIFFKDEVACGSLAVCSLGVFLLATRDYVFTEGRE